MSNYVHVDMTTYLRFCKATQIIRCYIFYRKEVNATLDKSEAQGVIEKTKFSDWTVPNVPIVKQDNTIRICKDNKWRVNKTAKSNVYPFLKTGQDRQIVCCNDKWKSFLQTGPLTGMPTITVG